MSVRVVQGHVLDVLEREPAQSVHCVVTSPPFWQLRAYGTEPQVWHGAADCEHVWGEEGEYRKGGVGQNKGLNNADGFREARDTDAQIKRTGAFCQRCGGWRGELGQEPTPEAFVADLVDVFRAVKRVLRDDGCCFVNLGDSYWSDPGGQNGTTGNVSARAVTANTQAGRQDRTSQKHARLKPGDLVGIPWAFAFAMQADGWVLRSAVTWIKTSPMPESIQGTRWERCKVKVGKGSRASDAVYSGASVPGNPHSAPRGPSQKFEGPTDVEWADCPGCPRCSETEGLVLRRGSGRPTSASELIFVFVKKMGAYYWDLEATRVPVSDASLKDGRTARAARGTTGQYGAVDGNCGFDPSSGRNAWNWMTFKSEPLKDEHYAAFSPGLPEFCIKAGTSERGVCPGCGAPWARIISRTPQPMPWNRSGKKQIGALEQESAVWDSGTPVHGGLLRSEHEATTTLGWRPTCPTACHQGRPPVRARVLDPFFGSGTTGVVADRLGRDCTGIDLKSEYVAMSQRRIVGDAPLFAEVSLEGAAG